MKIIVNAHKCEIDKTPVNEKEINITKCEFEFADEITSEFVKEAYFTLGKGETYKQIIVDNECDIPGEVLEKKGDITIGVVAYLVENNTTIKRYNPSPAYFNTWEGSLRDAENSQTITPSEMEQYEQALQDGLSEVNQKLVDIDEAIEDVNEAITETNNLDLDVSKSGKVATVTLTKKDATTKVVTLSDGTSLMFNWDGTKLGIKTDEDAEYTYVDLQGVQGPIGPKGEAFTIKKTYTSVAEMNSDFNNMQLGDYVMIASTVEVEDNAKLYTRGEEQWIFISDFSGATGIRGETGLTPNIQIGTVTSGETPSVTRTGTNENPVLNFTLVRGETGATGATGDTGPQGIGIASITKTSSEGLVDTYTITYTDGTTSTFNITNGEDGETPLSEFNALKADVEDLRDNQIILLEQGTNIHVEDAAKARLYEFKMDKESTQDGEPTPDNPVPVNVVEGIVNHFDKENIQWYRNNNSSFSSIANTSTNRIRTNSFAIVGGKTYTLSGIPEEIVLNNIRTYDELNGTNTNNFTRTENTFTLGENVKYIHLLFSGSDFTDETNTLMANANIQIVEGDQELPYVPYGNNYIAWKDVGKNLFDKDKEPVYFGATSYVSQETGVRAINTTQNTSYTSMIFEVMDLTQYVGKIVRFKCDFNASANNKGRYYIGIADSHAQNRTAKATSQVSGTEISFQVPVLSENEKYLIVALYSNMGGNANVGDYVDYTNIILTIDNEDITYEPYKETIVPLPLNGNEIAGKGNYLDKYIVDKNGHCWLEKNYLKYIFTGNEEFSKLGTTVHDVYQYSGIVDSTVIPPNNNSKIGMLSNYFIEDAVNNIYNFDVNGIGMTRTGQLDICLELSKEIDTVEKFKTYLQTLYQNGTPLELWYPLATPQPIDLNTTVDLKLFKEVNNITNSEDGNMRIRYVESIESIINDFDTRLKALEQGESL